MCNSKIRVATFKKITQYLILVWWIVLLSFKTKQRKVWTLFDSCKTGMTLIASEFVNSYVKTRKNLHIAMILWCKTRGDDDTSVSSLTTAVKTITEAKCSAENKLINCNKLWLLIGWYEASQGFFAKMFAKMFFFSGESWSSCLSCLYW